MPEPGNPQSLNRYAYVTNNPLRYTDPSGHWVETVWDIIGIGWDIYEVYRNPRDAWNWVALAADVGALVLPGVPAVAGGVARGGRAAKALTEVATHADELADAARVVEEAVSHADEAADAVRAVGRLDNGADALRAGREAIAELPKQMHHFATNKSSRWTDRMAEIAQKYGLDLDDAWNKEPIPQRGRHPDAYHEWVLDRMREIDEIATGDREVFLKLFEERVKKVVRETPEMLRKEYWQRRVE